jgi:ClpP class serine protease
VDPANVLLGAGWIVALVAAVYLGKSKAKDELIDTLQGTTDALRGDLEDAEARWQRKFDAEKNRCDLAISELRGQVTTLTPAFAKVMAAELAPVLGAAIAKQSGQ